MAETVQFVYEQLSPQSNVLVVINNELYNFTEQYARNIIDTRLLTLTKMSNLMPTANFNPFQAAPVNYITVTTVPQEFMRQPTDPKSNLRMLLELEKQYNEYCFKMSLANDTKSLKESTFICEDVTMSCGNDPNVEPTDQQLSVHQQLKMKKMSECHDVE